MTEVGSRTFSKGVEVVGVVGAEDEESDERVVTSAMSTVEPDVIEVSAVTVVLAGHS